MLTMAPRRTVLSSPQACQASGITYRQMDYWVRTGLITPSFGEAQGSGTSRRWSPEDVVALRVVAELMERGAGASAIRKAVVLAHGPDDYLWVTEAGVSAGTFSDLLRGIRGQTSIVLDLASLRRESAAA